MYRSKLLLAGLLLLGACSWANTSGAPNEEPDPGPSSQLTVTQIAVEGGYWRPISAPNVMMPAQEAQGKLEFDVGQCQCGIFPKNVATPVMMQYMPDQQRMVQTSKMGKCGQHTTGVLSECMRARGWEPTLCSGRLPTETGAYCPN
ncbi:MAG: hypothetical protein AB7G06_08080 [Bdellovibrionales bacterium]